MSHICVKNISKKRGMLALMSAIILSVILLILATTLSFTGFYSRFNILESETKEQSSALADACIDIALLNLAQNASYPGNLSYSVGEKTCFVGSVSTTGGEVTFKTRGIFSNSYTNLKIVLNETDLSVISVEEVPVF